MYSVYWVEWSLEVNEVKLDDGAIQDFYVFIGPQTNFLLNPERQGIPGWRSGLAPAFGPGRDPGDPGSCLLYTSPSPRDATLSRMPSSA